MVTENAPPPSGSIKIPTLEVDPEHIGCGSCAEMVAKPCPETLMDNIMTKKRNSEGDAFTRFLIVNLL